MASFDITTLHSSRNIPSLLVPSLAVATTQPLIQLAPPYCSRRDVKNTRPYGSLVTNGWKYNFTPPFSLHDVHMDFYLFCFILLYFILLYCTTHRLPEGYEVTGKTLCIQKANTNQECRALNRHVRVRVCWKSTESDTSQTCNVARPVYHTFYARVTVTLFSIRLSHKIMWLA